nr:ASN_HP1_G0046640.mRNA.1.CDS.1 [Saccharomyces cerevisiae]
MVSELFLSSKDYDYASFHILFYCGRFIAFMRRSVRKLQNFWGVQGTGPVTELFSDNFPGFTKFILLVSDSNNDGWGTVVGLPHKLTVIELGVDAIWVCPIL